MNLLHKIWRKLIFWIGDIRVISSFPFMTWGKICHLCDYEDSCEALKLIEPGDAGLHLDNRFFLSNLFIPGVFTHAWIHVYNDMIVEAISEGVVKRHALHALVSDYTVILRPKNVHKYDKEFAINKAYNAVGKRYDAKFNFDEHDEFSCTELAFYCWAHCKDLLKFSYIKFGKKILKADDFLDQNFEIVWCSESVKNLLKNKKFNKEALGMLEDYFQNRRKQLKRKE